MLLRKYEYFMDKNMLWFTLNHWNVKIESKMIHSESESDFNFAINLASDFNSVSNSASDSDYESDFSAAFMNVDICISFIFYICIPLNKPADAFFLSILMTESIVMQAMEVKCIFSFGVLLPK